MTSIVIDVVYALFIVAMVFLKDGFFRLGFINDTRNIIVMIMFMMLVTMNISMPRPKR